MPKGLEHAPTKALDHFLSTLPRPSVPTIHVHAVPSCDLYRVELDGRSVGPVLTKEKARIVAEWLESAWTELP